jgi:predicted DNA-binding transcriptional regulator AlpA
MSTPSQVAQTPIRFLKLPELIARLGISRSEAFRRIRNTPSFPKPIRMGIRSVVYSSVEVDAYIFERIAQRDSMVVLP